MTKDIFVSYRRNDEPGTTGRIHDYLVRVAGVPPKRIFLDVDNLIPGTNFVQEINRRLSTCELLLAIIGKRWITSLLEARDSDDFVRVEISAALSRPIPVIPILVDGTKMPSEPDLPPSLRPLCQQHAIQIQNASFERDIRPLVDAIQWHQPEKQKKSLAGQIFDQLGGLFGPKDESRVSSGDIARLGGLFYLAEGGDPLASYEIGTRFEKGHGVGKNPVLARRYYERSSQAGYKKPSFA